MAIETDTADAPAHWACYLVNGDASGMLFSDVPGNDAGTRDVAECDAWVESLAADGWHVVSTVDDSERFGRWRGMGCELVTYQLLRHV